MNNASPLMISACRLALAALLFSCAKVAVRADDSEAITPKEKVDLLADPEFKDFTANLKPDGIPKDEPKDIWKIDDQGLLRISGRGWGYLRTNKKYRDYHLVLEYSWGEKTWGERAANARDCGVLVHAYGEDGVFDKTWIASIESQLIEGGSGDILVLAPPDENGAPHGTSLTSEFTLDRDGEKIWTPGAEKAAVASGRINWLHRDPDWEDKIGFRGAREIENVPGEWNRMEVICQGGAIDVLLNGVRVNAGTEATPTEGYICLQTECAEVLVRRYELWPLGKFDEKWNDADKK